MIHVIVDNNQIIVRNTTNTYTLDLSLFENMTEKEENNRLKEFANQTLQTYYSNLYLFFEEKNTSRLANDNKFANQVKKFYEMFMTELTETFLIDPEMTLGKLDTNKVAPENQPFIHGPMKGITFKNDGQEIEFFGDPNSTVNMICSNTFNSPFLFAPTNIDNNNIQSTLKIMSHPHLSNAIIKRYSSLDLALKVYEILPSVDLEIKPQSIEDSKELIRLMKDLGSKLDIEIEEGSQLYEEYLPVWRAKDKFQDLCYEHGLIKGSVKFAYTYPEQIENLKKYLEKYSLETHEEKTDLITQWKNASLEVQKYFHLLLHDQSQLKELFSLDFIKELEKESQLRQQQDDDHPMYDQEQLLNYDYSMYDQEQLLNDDHQQEIKIAGAQQANH